MSEPFLSEIKILSFNFPPKGWAFCNGQILPINQNQALFALLGTTYGGNGQTTFALPNLQGRVPIHMGNGFTLGQLGGESAHTLNISEVPAHTHTVSASTGTATAPTPSGNIWCSDATNPYGTSPDSAMNPACVLPTGGSQGHDNMSPYLVLSFAIALQGIFPSQN